MSKISIEGNSSGTGTFTIASPNSNTNRTLNLPDNAGTFITTGSTTGIDASALSTGTVAAARLPAGSVLQVVQTVKTDSFSTTSTSYTDVTGMSVTITPSSASNKILVLLNATVGSNGGANYCYVLLTDGTNNFQGDAAGSRRRATVGGALTQDNNTVSSACACWLHSPNTTSAITYKMQIASQTNGITAGCNRASADTDSSAVARTVSSITVMEIAG